MAAGTGPVAIDAERASGYRYSARAYLIQLRREGAGTCLVDPIAFDVAGAAAGGPRRHRVDPARRDPGPALPDRGRPAPRRGCSTPSSPARLLGYPRVGLATLVETLLGCRMAKEHSAVDWSTRPLPEPWLEYAALDVEVLVELREVLGAELVEAGKDGWAAEEFEWLKSFTQTARVGPVAAYVGPAQGARPPGPGRRTRPVDDPRPDRGRARRHPEPDHPRLRDRGGRARDAHHPHGPEGHQGLLRPRRRPVRRPLGRRPDAGPRPARGPAADADAALRRAAAAARLGRQGPGRRPASAAGPRGDHRARRRSWRSPPRTC